MSLLYMEGWDEFSIQNGIAASSRGGNRLYVHANYSPGQPGLWGFGPPVADQHTTMIVGGYWTVPTNGISGAGADNCSYQNFYSTDATIEIKWTTAQGIRVVKNGVTLGSSDSGVWAQGTGKFFETKVIAHPSAGQVIVKLNGSVVVNLTGLNTGSAPWSYLYGNASAYISYGVAGGCTTVDDLYVLNGAGSDMNDFLGDVRIMALWQSGNGALSDWVGSDGNSTDNYALVRWDHPGGSYVQAATVGDTDAYDFQPIEELFPGSAPTIDPDTTQVLGVQVSGQAIKTDSVATKKVAVVARDTGGTVVEGPQTAIETTTSYFSGIFPRQPDGTPWTLEDLNSAEFGIRIKQ